LSASYFTNNNWTQHSDVVYEAKEFISPSECSELLQFIDKNSGENNNLVWDGSSVTDGLVPEISMAIHQMHDAASRYSMSSMRLAKVIAHVYVPGGSGPLHADVFPLATLLYLNDDYEGGELFFENGLEIKPKSRSLLAFDGGQTNRHGVSQIQGKNNRYVLVAFWEYDKKEDQQLFWDKEVEIQKKQIEDLSQEFSSNESGQAEILYPHTFPILKITNFITPELAKKLVEYMVINHVQVDDCYGPACFKEYYEKEYGKLAEPILVDGVSESTLSEINSEIGSLVNKLYGSESDPLVFSKFKGHGHVQGARTPPHTHGPAEAVAVIVLTEDYDGGETFIPMHDIELRHEPYALYIFSEANDLRHGVRTVERGSRISLISHWQKATHPYSNAGANI